jgi:DNA-binding MarR family transcriptional regulator
MIDHSEAVRLREYIRALVRRFALAERADIECCGLTVAQAAALEVLLREGPMRLGDLGRRLGITPSTLTRNLTRLENRGLIARSPDPDDRRASRVELTQTGRTAASEVEEQEIAFAETILEALPEDQAESVVNGLGNLLGAIRIATEDCCPGAFDHLMPEAPESSDCCS